MSRVVRCGIVSIPHARSIATEAMTPLIRARARGLSLTSTKCALPDSAAHGPPRRARRCSRRAAGRAEPRRRTPARAASARGRSPRRRLGRVGQLALAHDERRGGRAVLVDRGPDRLDLRRRRAAAAADDPGAEPARLGRELGEVVRRRVREDDAAAGEAREADVRQRGEDEPLALHRGERVQRGGGPGAVVRARGGDVELGEPLGRLLAETPPSVCPSASNVISATIGSDETCARRRSRRRARRGRRTSRA